MDENNSPVIFCITPENEKSTITVDEDDILRMSDKIRINIEEDNQFEKIFDNFLKSTEKSSDFLRIGLTSNALAISGANKELDVVIAPRTIAKCMSEADEKYHGHALSAEIMKKLPQELRNPVMILKGSVDNSLVAITELKDSKQREVMISVSLDEEKRFRIVNRISSVYGRSNFKNYLKAQIEKNNLISCNIEKADKLFSDIGIQSPKSTTIICFDNSISYSMQNVKFPEQDLQVNKEKANKVLRSNGLQLPPENTLNGSNNSISPSTEKVNSSEKNIIEKLLAEGKAEFNNDGSFKINNDYYRALPREDRTIEVVPVQHAAEIMQQLADKGIEFSAVSRKNEKAAITVHIEHKSDLTSAAENAVKGQIQKNQPTVSKTAAKEIINPDYFKQLKSSERHIQRLPSGDADKIIASLESKGVKFSAVKGEKLTSITVHKDDRAAVGQAVHENNRTAAKEYINSDYFKSLPPEQRVYSQTADLNAAKTLMNALDSEAVQYSAVIDNEKSNARITIAKEDIPKAQKTGFLFSRQAQKSFTEKAQTQNNEREATRVSEHKKENHTI